jgi:hypothetical protein
LDARRKVRSSLKFLLIDLIYFPPQRNECHGKGKERKGKLLPTFFSYNSPQKKRVCNCYEDSDKLIVAVQEPTDSSLYKTVMNFRCEDLSHWRDFMKLDARNSY